MDFDDILKEVGDFGFYQKCVLWFILLPAVFPCGFHAYNQLFMAAVPKHWCQVPKSHLEPLESPEMRTCLTDERIWDNSSLFPNSKELQTNTTLVPCKFGWTYDRSIYESTVVTEWDLVCADRFGPTEGLIVFGVGGVIGNYIFGYLQDGIGRKPSFFIYLLIQTVFGIGTGLVPNFGLWLLCRFGVGFTVPAILATPYVLAVELVGPSYRTIVTVLINIAYSLALITLAVVVWAIRNWRPLALYTTLPFLALFPLWAVMPESPRWLLVKGRKHEALEIVQTIAKWNKRNLTPTNWTDLKPTVSNQRIGTGALFRTSNLRWKTVIITVIWFTNTSVYVGLSYYAPMLGGDEFLNFFLAGLVELPTYLFLWPALESWGRRWTLCTSMIIGGSACLATFLVQNDPAVTLILYCIGKMGISSSFVVLPLMASELYPTVVRGLGISISSVVGMLGPVFIPLVNYLGSDMLTLPLIIMGAMLVLGGALSLLLPETLNRNLPQTLEDAENTGLEDCSICCSPPYLQDS